MSVNPRIRKAIEESEESLPENVRWAVENFAKLVPEGRAPDLEKHTRVLYDAFAPLRKILGSKITLYRGEPLDPPKIKRKWLSWTPDPRMAAQFVESGRHIIEANVSARDIVAGILSPYNDSYIEFLVLDKPAYHQPSPSQVPSYNYVRMEEKGWQPGVPWEDIFPDWEGWARRVRQDVEKAGGKVLKVDPPDSEEEKAPMVGYLLPAGASLARFEGEIPGGVLDHHSFGKIASARRVALLWTARRVLSGHG